MKFDRHAIIAVIIMIAVAAALLLGAWLIVRSLIDDIEGKEYDSTQLTGSYSLYMPREGYTYIATSRGETIISGNVTHVAYDSMYLAYIRENDSEKEVGIINIRTGEVVNTVEDTDALEREIEASYNLVFMEVSEVLGNE